MPPPLFVVTLFVLVVLVVLVALAVLAVLVVFVVLVVLLVLVVLVAVVVLVVFVAAVGCPIGPLDVGVVLWPMHGPRRLRPVWCRLPPPSGCLWDLNWARCRACRANFHSRQRLDGRLGERLDERLG